VSEEPNGSAWKNEGAQHDSSDLKEYVKHSDSANHQKDCRGGGMVTERTKIERHVMCLDSTCSSYS
jgi:hypothetical protein